MIFLFILIVVLIVSIIIFKRKFKQTSALDTPTVDEGGETFNMRMQENESYISTPHIPVTNEDTTTVPLSPVQEYDSVNTENHPTFDTEGNVQVIKNDAYVATPHIPVTTNESYATTVALTPNQAYGSRNSLQL